MKRALFVIGFISLFFSAIAQQVGLGEWRNHLNYSSVRHVAVMQTKVYSACDAGLFFIDNEDNSSNRLSTTDGLSGIEVTAMNSNNTKDKLYIGYSNGVIDVISGTTITTLNDVSRAQIIGNKRINDFYFYSDTICYISTGFGIMKFNAISNEFLETYFIGDDASNVYVNSSLADADSLYAFTNEGLYSGGLKTFLYSNENWRKNNQFPEPDANLSHGIEFAGGLHINIDRTQFKGDTVYTRWNTAWELNDTLSAENNGSFEIKNNRLLVANSGSFEIYDTAWKVVRREFQSNDKALAVNVAKYGTGNEVWMGDNYLSLIKNSGPFNNQEYTFSGPVSNKSFKIVTSPTKLYNTGGAYGTNGARRNLDAEISIFENEGWTQLSQFTSAALDTMVDLVSVSENPRKRSQFVGASMGNGLVMFENNKVTQVYDHRNSPLADEAGIATFVTGVQYDQNGVVWMTNPGSTQPIHALQPNGTWTSFTTDTAGKEVPALDLLVTPWGHVWFIISGKGIGVLDYNKTLNNFTDDKYIELLTGSSSGNLPNGRVTSMALDNDGNIWVGTIEGLVVFYNAQRVFSPSSRNGREILINQDGQTQLLFDKQFLTQIHVDPANRKWVSTAGNGVYLMSADGTKEVQHFTEENSPLFSNNVNTVGVYGQTGEVFFGTEKGIQTFREEATYSSSDFSNIVAFPNPVRPGFDGLIGISGISDQAEVIITDVSGNKVFKTTSNGGQATWDGRDFNGNRVITGVYLIYCTSEDGTESGVAKILIEN